MPMTHEYALASIIMRYQRALLSADPDAAQASDPYRDRFLGAQNAQFWAASVSVRHRPTSAHNGGYSRAGTDQRQSQNVTGFFNATGPERRIWRAFVVIASRGGGKRIVRLCALPGLSAVALEESRHGVIAGAGGREG